LVEDCSVIKAHSAGQWVKCSLKERATRVTLVLDLNYWLSRCVIVFSKRLFVIVELLIILLVSGVILCLSRFVISNVDILEKGLLLFTVSLLNESFNLSLILAILLGIPRIVGDSLSHLNNLKV
jgi:hypothetical protein